MLKIYYDAKDAHTFELQESDDLIAVRTHSRRSLRRARGPVPPPVPPEIADAAVVAAFPEAGVEVFRVPQGEGLPDVRARKLALRAHPDVRFAGGVLIDPADRSPVLYTENVFVRFRDDADPEDCAQVLVDAGLTRLERVGYAANAWFAAAPEGTGRAVFTTVDALLARPDVETCHPELIREAEVKAIAPQQWHLARTTVNGVEIDQSAGVADAHARSTGAGVIIAVIDDGVDVDHPEFLGRVVAPRDATRRTSDPRPRDAFGAGPEDGDNHGTACAGVACAAGRAGASGVAPDARLMPIRLASALGSKNEAEAFQWAADHGADVISCSWGPPDGAWYNPADPRHSTRVALPASTRLALEYAARKGRGGKGCVIFFAAGNGNEPVENDGYASSPEVIAVAACNDRGRRSVYSDHGAAVWCAFPSNDFAHATLGSPAPLTPGIWTTDRTGAAGYNPGDTRDGDAAGLYTDSFGGTSSACPGAAGIAALVLSANPALTAAGVRDVLRRCCDRIDPEGGAYDASGRSPKYGYGRLNARRAVELAAPAPRREIALSRTLHAPIPDLGTLSEALDVTDTGTVAAVTVTVRLSHTWIGDLVLTLTPPSGAPVVLHDKAGGSAKDIRRTWDATALPALAALAGQGCAGIWRLTVQDTAAQDVGTLESFGLSITLA